MERPLRENEVVHHLNFDRSNNSPENLLVLENSQHAKLHMWLKKYEIKEKERKNKREHLYCLICSKPLIAKQKRFCSDECYKIGIRKVERPSMKQLSNDIQSMSWVAIGKKYGVSDNAVRKWARKYGLIS